MMAKMKKFLCKMMRVPAFVPPVLIVINLYVIFTHHDCFVKPVGKRRVMLSHLEDCQRTTEFEQLEKNNSNRMRGIKQTCDVLDMQDSFRSKPMSGEAFAATDLSFVFCVVPKVGCTYWKRILRFINHDHVSKAETPEDISRVETHFGDWNRTRILKLSNASQLHSANNGGTKFMFARDPYTRLWSGYLDKLYLPDFWWWLGTKIIKETRPGANELSLECGHDVTFSEFLQYTVNHLRTGKHVDMHFEPVYTRCNPCHMHFDIVGKLETFNADMKLVMNKANLQHLIAHTAKSKRDLEEIVMLTKYNFDIQTRLISLGNRSECYDQPEVAKRIWKTFQFNGYLGDEYEFPEAEFSNIQDKESIKTTLLEKLVHKRKLATAEQVRNWSKQRRKYLVKAYQSVPRELIEGIQETYSIDFDLFHYNTEPVS